MDLFLTRLFSRKDGIFSELTNEAEDVIAVALEHSYEESEGLYLPKIPYGEFECIRSMHRLHGMTSDFPTFEVMDVPNHSGILFHWGNWNKDSDGCIILGRAIDQEDNEWALVDSRKSFADFMQLQKGIKSFILTVQA